MSENKNQFFSHAERSLIVHELLMRTKYDEDNDKFGEYYLLSIVHCIVSKVGLE